ncbi:fungal fruit body lectin [Aspergillus floccosus]
MSYTINLSVRNSTSDALAVVEKACWHYANGGTWTEQDGQHVLSMGGSGTSGMLRFKSSSGEIFTIVLGIHNYEPWGDLQVNLRDDDTTAKMLPEYYSGGKYSDRATTGLMNVVTSHGKMLGFVFEETEGHKLSAVMYYDVEPDRRVY